MTRRPPPLGGLAAGRFLRSAWQRRPLLIRQAVTEAATIVDVAGLRRFAARDDVESRLVRTPAFDPGPGRRGAASAGHGWSLAHGPFDRLPALTRPGWTLLVQGFDTVHEPARALLDRFRFIADARIDDVMVSLASPGGGVGPHVDSYDVFLLQVAGHRRWRIAPPGDAPLLPGLPLRILARFEPTQEWVLAPGDMLYLPPGWAHDGTALDTCLTCSIGFRSPSPAELRRAFHAFLADQDDDPPTDPDPAGARGPRAAVRYRDAQRDPALRPARLPEHMLATLDRWLVAARPPAELRRRFIGCFLTEPKPHVWFEQGAATPATLRRDRAILVDRRSRMLYRGRLLFVNGEALTPPASARRWLARLADRRILTPADLARCAADRWLEATLLEWLNAGWIRHAEQ